MVPMLNPKLASRAVASLVAVWTLWAALHFSSLQVQSVSSWLGSEQPPALPELPPPPPPPPQPASRRNDTLISFTYFETPNARRNLDFFIRKALHWNADFVFIFNGETDAPDMLPDMDNIRVVRRDNTCYDLGAVGEVMRMGDMWTKYKRFISINASVRGPFLPYWSDDCWSDLYLSKITDRVKLVGMTANCLPRRHVQSMIFATDTIGMSVLLDPARAVIGIADPWGGADDPVGLSGCYADYSKAVHSEIGLTTLIEQAGYEADVMMTAFHQSGGGTLAGFCGAVSDTDDLLYHDHYFGFNVHPFETIFMKTNRNIDPVAVEKLTQWTLARTRRSFDTCAG